MRANIVDLGNRKVSGPDLEGVTSKIQLGEVFADSNINYLNKFTLYLAYFNAIPNYIHDIEISCKKASDWFYKNFSEEIRDSHYKKRFFKGRKDAAYLELYYVLKDEIIVQFDFEHSYVRILFKDESADKVNLISKELKRFKLKKNKSPEIFLLVNTPYGIETKPFVVSKVRLSIDDNYNDDFMEIHKNIMRRLSNKEDKGLILLHGKPGTGKTSYIRYLISAVSKNVIFLPPNMAAEITNPGLISVLIDNPNTIFVIEDAENIVVDRERNGHSPVSALLNISDGLLSDCLNIQIICSFNTDISKVDSALMRKGRLIAKYEFKELTVEKSNALSKKLGFEGEINTPMSLTDIYNHSEPNFNKASKTRGIGFSLKS